MSTATDDAPAVLSKDSAQRPKAPGGSGSASAHTETINRPREEVYAFWRDFTNLPKVMENVLSIEVKGDRTSHWKVAGPDGAYEWDATITEDEPDRLIAWQSDEGADVAHTGRVEFRDAPPGRGTWVTATIAYAPPGGFIGKAVAKLTQKEPSIQARRDMRRLKQFLETGEIATTTPPNRQPDS
jgi:uncharacterized membrane protein